MTKKEKLLVCELAATFEEKKEVLMGNWLELVENRLSLGKNIESATIKRCFELMINDFSSYLSKGDFEGYYKSNNLTGIELALHDISYRKFISAFHLFEDSYLPILFNMYTGETLASYLSAVDKLHHYTIATVTEAFFKIKDSTVDALINLSELRDDITGKHMERTKEYLLIIAKELELDDDYIYQLSKAGPLHDIGKIGIPDSILLKPGRLSSDEYEEMKKHTVIGAQAIEKIYRGQVIKAGYLLMARDIALYHHEKYDGTGYPESLSGSQIPLSARIFALVDAYDAIVSKRPYKEPLSHELAIERITHDSGSHFDPQIVDTFLKIHERFEAVKDNITG